VRRESYASSRGSFLRQELAASRLPAFILPGHVPATNLGGAAAGCLSIFKAPRRSLKVFQLLHHLIMD
jgi:hypothetical protein